MVVQLEILSKQIIIPSSPTPFHLRDLKFSFFDQTAVPIYTPFIFFYQTDHQLGAAADLKLSLSHTLTVFYPLAGRIQTNNSSIKCNDQGVEFIEARVHAPLINVIQDPDMEELRQLLPVQPHHHLHHEENSVLSVQINLFDCGGFAIAVCLSHKIADGTSLSAFMKAWATISRGEALDLLPNFHVLSTHFPSTDSSQLHLSPSTAISSDKIVTKRYIFDDEMVAALKAAIATAPGSQVTDPTRVEAVSAFIWKHFVEQNLRSVNAPSFATLHPVNMRPRMDPPLPDDVAFGNGIAISAAFTDSDQNHHELHQLANELRSAIRKINSDYIKEEIKSDMEGYYLNQLGTIGTILKEGTRVCNFSSWCRFPVYEVDYGWGKPVWVCTTPLPFKNLVILMSRASGEGIEAWVNMVEDDMNSLQMKI